MYSKRSVNVSTERSPKENDLTFGVELECLFSSRATLANVLRDRNININYEGYNHNSSKTAYKIVSDGSVRETGLESSEIVSPILKGAKGLQSLQNVCNELTALNVKVNKTCGLHVHIGAEKFTSKQWQNLYINYFRLENLIDSFMPGSRRGNFYCKGLQNLSNYENNIMRCSNVDDIKSYFNSDRYFKINPCSYSRHKTVEFRQHGGTVEFEKVEMWVSFLRKLVVFSQNNLVENCSSINDLTFLNASEKRFFNSRVSKFQTV